MTVHVNDTNIAELAHLRWCLNEDGCRVRFSSLKIYLEHLRTVPADQLSAMAASFLWLRVDCRSSLAALFACAASGRCRVRELQDASDFVRANYLAVRQHFTTAELLAFVAEQVGRPNMLTSDALPPAEDGVYDLGPTDVFISGATA